MAEVQHAFGEAGNEHRITRIAGGCDEIGGRLRGGRGGDVFLIPDAADAFRAFAVERERVLFHEEEIRVHPAVEGIAEGRSVVATHDDPAVPIGVIDNHLVEGGERADAAGVVRRKVRGKLVHQPVLVHEEFSGRQADVADARPLDMPAACVVVGMGGFGETILVPTGDGIAAHQDDRAVVPAHRPDRFVGSDLASDAAGAGDFVDLDALDEFPLAEVVGDVAGFHAGPFEERSRAAGPGTAAVGAVNGDALAAAQTFAVGAGETVFRRADGVEAELLDHLPGGQRGGGAGEIDGPAFVRQADDVDFVRIIQILGDGADMACRPCPDRPAIRGCRPGR